MDHFLLCAIRDCINDSPVPVKSRDRMHKLLDALSDQANVVQILVQSGSVQGSALTDLKSVSERVAGA